MRQFKQCTIEFPDLDKHFLNPDQGKEDPKQTPNPTPIKKLNSVLSDSVADVMQLSYIPKLGGLQWQQIRFNGEFTEIASRNKIHSKEDLREAVRLETYKERLY